MGAVNPEFVLRLESLLSRVYPKEHIGDLIKKILHLGEKWNYGAHRSQQWVDGTNIYLITYGDTISQPDKPPLATLNHFAHQHLNDTISDIHILPMYPYSSDDGFSVIDYRRIDDHLGGWSDIHHLAANFNLMFDCVINHISRSSDWLKGYINDEPYYRDYFIDANPELDYSRVVRPRASPLLTPFIKADGTELYLWTTFSEDQIDINFKNPQVLLESIDVILQYAASGGQSIRLDAIGYIWKEMGTPCIHRPQAHNIIKLWRTILDEVIPGTRIITETNVPHHENISYFGEGDEAHMVYQFALPPLTLHAFLRQDTRTLTQWAQGLNAEAHYPKTTYFNFLSSHDGIGLRPTETFLDDNERKYLAQETQRKEGRVSYKDNGDGTHSPYELNINYLSAITEVDDSIELKANKFLAAQALLLSFMGVPAIYIHSLLGSENDLEGMHQSGLSRRISRKKLQLDDVEKELTQPGSLRSRVFNGIKKLIAIRRTRPAFSPQAGQRVFELGDKLFALERYDPKSENRISCIFNISGQSQTFKLAVEGKDLIAGEQFTGQMRLQPWQVVWIEHKLKAPERLGRLRRWRKKIFISLKRSEANRLLTGRPRKAKR
ncbi:sugar phosphorylase [Rouxiella silvae]|uniref:Sugar phosphorylase n=1 Tax=Rouxiella silvae TaxID=1646373 RepID=A0ABX3U188_9GAMM|nr:alpha-amylase family glycosyl hydrolase [Rouxiella silvae]ORJ21243.1 sugar phosphorylase [Rouxiella silvae]